MHAARRIFTRTSDVCYEGRSRRARLPVPRPLAYIYIRAAHAGNWISGLLHTRALGPFVRAARSLSSPLPSRMVQVFVAVRIWVRYIYT